MNFLLEHRAELWLRLGEHLSLTVGSVALAVVSGIPLGVLARRRPKWEGIILSTAGILQTIPSLAMLSLLMVGLASMPPLPFIGRVHAIGTPPALIALTLYALLPIIRNTVAGLRGVPEAALEAADGLGMTISQRLRLVEMPLAVPVVVAGMRTAAVIGVGVTTLSAFIGAGGLGEFINRGLYLSQNQLILLGALPAAWLALILDRALGWAESLLVRGPQSRSARWRAFRGLAFVAVPAAAAAAFLTMTSVPKSRGVLAAVPLRAAFTGEFIERPDGLPGLERAYGLRFLEVRDMEASLMYQAIAGGSVDLISAYSTDGRLQKYKIRLLADDRHFFPPYEAAPVVREAALKRVPGLAKTLELLSDRIDETAMRRLNFDVDELKRSPETVAREFLQDARLMGPRSPSAKSGSIVIGTKAFTEGVLLGEIMAQLIESHLGIRVEKRFNLGGTMIVHNALKSGEIDAYAEYTGTALTAILNLPADGDRRRAFEAVANDYERRFACRWLKPFGFSNSYALGVREADARNRGWKTIGDLKNFERGGGSRLDGNK